MSIESLRSRRPSEGLVELGAEDTQKRHRGPNYAKMRNEAPAIEGQGWAPVGHFKFTKERKDAIVDSLRKCNYRKVAASMAGITESTLSVWLKQGKKEESGPYRDFYEAVMKAEAEAEATIVERVRTASEDDWKAGMDLLRRRYPKRWNRDRVELTGAKGGPVVLKVVYDDGHQS